MIYLNKDKITCPRCGARTVPAKSISGGESTFWLMCSRIGCRTYINTYVPMNYQADFHTCDVRYTMIAGGYGSAKTTSCFMDDEKHIILTNGRTLIGANTVPQLENTVKKDLENDFPADFVESVNVKKSTIRFLNGHELLYRPMNDEGNLRSMNLTRFHLLEASEIDFDNFTQLQTRLRNHNGLRYKRDAAGDLLFNEDGKLEVELDLRRGLVESNPDAGWIRNDFLLKSNVIKQYAIPTNYFVSDPDVNKATFIVPTRANVYLPPNYEKEVSSGKPSWWVKRYLSGSFDYVEGMVYPEVMSTLVPDAHIVNSINLRYAVGLDYGIGDNTHIVFAVIDPIKKKITVYDELVMNSRNVTYMATEYLKKLNAIPRGQLLSVPVMDARSFAKRADTQYGELKTIGQMFTESGALFRPAQMDLDSRIMRLNTFIEHKQLEIVSSKCPILTKEIINYKFPDKSLDNSKNVDTPVDKNNHGVNALEFLIMEIPMNFEVYFERAYTPTGKVKTRSELDAEENDLLSVSYNPLAPSYASNKSNRARVNLKNIGGDLWKY